jgi:glycine betaine/proline transport system ATP-binding protein
VLIQCDDLWKIFGSSEQAALADARAGATRDELMQRFQAVLAVAGVSFTVAEGEIFVIMGLSGSGKSTLVRHLNRLVEPTAGRVLIDSHDIGSLDAAGLRSLRSETLGMVFQHVALLPHRTVLDNVAFGLELRDVPKAERHRIAAQTLSKVELDGWGDRLPSELSGGMSQRVGLARALASDPPILLMDEPFSALDPLIRRGLQTEFQRLSHELGKTTVFITHDLDEALRLGDRIAILRDGALVQCGTPAEIVGAPADDYVAEFVRGVSGIGALTAASLLPAESTLDQASSAPAAGPSVDASAPLHEVLRVAAQSNDPIMVVRDGRVIGALSRGELLDALSERVAPEGGQQ